MLILAFDTATERATSALVDDGEVLGERVSRASTLLADVDALLRRAGAHPREIDALAVGTGPGSFTGVSAAEWADLEPYFDDAVVFVEWPEAGAAGLPEVRAAIRLEHDSPTSRVLRIEAEPELLARVAT